MCSASNSETLVAGSPSPNGHHKSHEVVTVKSEDHDLGDLKSWMHNNGLPPCKVVLDERPSHNAKHRPIHYVAASEDLQVRSDIAFSVPNSLVVTLERVLGNETVAELLTTNKLSELACLALYLMYEKKQGKKSFWYPYIKELDRQRGRGQLAVESPLLWSEAELNYLTGSPTKGEVLERAEGIKREYSELDTVWFMAGSLFQQYPYDIPTEAFPFEIFKQAFVAVQSCVVHLQVYVGREKETISEMPPYLRLGYVSDPSEMQFVLSSQGDPLYRRAVLDQLAEYFKTRLLRYPTTLSEDEALIMPLDPKKRVATQLVRLEKKIPEHMLADNIASHRPVT
nr:ribulose-1,5 bisphosphate carboxylase/oxygenase large subunit N-methyltransferase, chloroplastic isoform X1 [Ipomoea batatas]